ncbi:DUF418 domain-containing protein [Streptomyces sp. NPDC004838]
MSKSPSSQRVPSLDVLRGVAIIGTLLTNIWIFVPMEFDPGSWTSTSPGSWQQRIQELSGVVSNGKFLGLLSILFGVGIAIQFESAMRQGLRWPWRYEWRALLLLADGFLHFALVVSFDILMGYALVAMVVAPLLRLRDRWLAVATALATAVHLALEFRRAEGMQSSGRETSPEPTPDDLKNNVDTGAGAPDVGYLDEVVMRIEDFWNGRYEAFVIAPPLSAALFLAGVLLWRRGLFRDDERARTLSRRLALWGLGTGVPLSLWRVTPLPGAEDLALDLSRYVFAPLVAFGYLGLGLILLRRFGSSGFVARRFADVGKTALSCYMLQNVVALVIFSPWAFGLGALGAVGTLVAWAAISALLMAAASWWLRHHRQGPFELVWRAAGDAPFRRGRKRADDTPVPVGQRSSD